MTPLTSAPPSTAESLQAGFLALLPRLEAAVRARLRFVPCPGRRDDLAGEAVALCWRWYVRLAEKGRSPDAYVATFARLAARAALSGRRVDRGETADDVLSPVARRRRGFTLSPLPDPSVAVGAAFLEALHDNSRTPVPDQVQFRIDFPRWRAGLGARKRLLLDALAAGHRTADVAASFGVTPGRVSQVRRELCEGWRAFCGDDAP